MKGQKRSPTQLHFCGKLSNLIAVIRANLEMYKQTFDGLID